MKILILILTFISIVVYTYKVNSQALKELSTAQGLLIVVVLFLIWCFCYVVKQIFKGDQ